MAGSEPGERPTPSTTPPAGPAAGPQAGPASRRLAAPPSARYGDPRAAAGAGGDPATGASAGSALTGPLLRATLVALAGAGALVVVGAILTLPEGLPFVAGLTGGAAGLVLARAAAPRDGARPVARGSIVWLAVALSVGAVAVAAVATWLFAMNVGGTLGLVDYLVETFGLFVPAEAVIAAIAAAWGANAGPVQA